MENRIPWKFEVPMFGYNRQIEMQNIFDSVTVYNETLELCEEYAKDEMTFAIFLKRFDYILKARYWSKYEYEIGLTIPLWSKTDIANPLGAPFKKADVYSLIKPNIEIIAKYVIDTFNSYSR
jgi:hypothetical protein